MSQPERPVVHVVGCHETNYPWGFENRVIPALERLGFAVVATDYRRNRSTLSQRLATPAAIVLVCKGEGIAASAIAAAPGCRVLWYAEQVGTLARCDDAARERRRELAENIRAFDGVFCHDQSMIEVHLALGAQSATWASTACVDPLVHQKLDVPKRYDVLFAGTLTPRRAALFEALKAHAPAVHVVSTWDPVELNRLFNESRIVLNLHLSDLPNTETRVAEVVGSGAFLLTEELSSPSLVEAGVHVESVETGNVAALAARIRHFLEHERERETIAAAGHAHMHGRHTLDVRLGDLLRRTVEIQKGRTTWPAGLGVLHDCGGAETDQLGSFREAVARARS